MVFWLQNTHWWGQPAWGIKIGIIKEIIEAKNVTENYAILETEVDFKNLEYVLVIRNN